MLFKVLSPSGQRDKPLRPWHHGGGQPPSASPGGETFRRGWSTLTSKTKLTALWRTPTRPSWGNMRRGAMQRQSPSSLWLAGHVLFIEKDEKCWILCQLWKVLIYYANDYANDEKCWKLCQGWKVLNITPTHFRRAPTFVSLSLRNTWKKYQFAGKTLH